MTIMTWSNNTIANFLSSPTKSDLSNVGTKFIGMIVMPWTRYISNLQHNFCVRHYLYLSYFNLCQAIRSLVVVLTRSSCNHLMNISMLTNYKRFSVLSEWPCWIIRAWSAICLFLI